jgi:Zn-dependent protease
VTATLCDECGAQIGPGLLACPGCARLVHREELKTLAGSAAIAEKAGDLTAALTAWRRTLELLPRGTQQHAQVQKRLQQLSAAVDGRAAPPHGEVRGTNKGARAGTVAAMGAVGLALFKSKALIGLLLTNGKLLLLGLLKLPTLLSMIVYAQWMKGSGIAFGVGLVASIYVHEVGHVAALRRYGIAASAPMFVPGFGAFVRLSQYPTDAHEEARTGLAGPLWGLVAAVVAAIAGALAHSAVASSVASLGATINLFNLVPVWFLDGSRGLRALSRAERFAVGGVGIACGLFLHQWMPAIVGAVAVFRGFGSDAHPEGDRGMVALFAVLLVALSLLATLPVSVVSGG